MSKWRTIETEEVVWEGAKAEQARFDKLQADVKNGKVRLVDGTQELIQGIKRFTEEELRLAEEGAFAITDRDKVEGISDIVRGVKTFMAKTRRFRS